jgi:hypothetical protein
MTAVLERVRSWKAPPALGPMALLIVSLLGVAVVVYGALFNRPEIRIVYYDTGPVSQFAIGEVQAYPDVDLYVVGLPDGRLRALDGRIEGTTCRVQWRPSDERGVPHNPGSRPGVFEDPCTGATWSRVGNAIAGSDRPLRTPHIDPRPVAGSRELHIFVELINP